MRVSHCPLDKARPRSFSLATPVTAPNIFTIVSCMIAVRLCPPQNRSPHLWAALSFAHRTIVEHMLLLVLSSSTLGLGHLLEQCAVVSCIVLGCWLNP